MLTRLKHADLPRLQWKGDESQRPGVLEDWMQRIQLDLCGHHHLINRYWTEVVRAVRRAYEVYLRHEPLDRPAIRPSQPSELPQRLEDVGNFHSCELKLRGLLLHLVPEDVKKPCLKTRATSTLDILYQAHISAGPGTGSDCDYTLNAVQRGEISSSEVDLRRTAGMEILPLTSYHSRGNSSRPENAGESTAKDI